MEALVQLQTEVGNRAEETRRQHTDWPCAKGCDACCRSLAELPALTAAEWALIEQGLSRLDPQELLEVERRVLDIEDAGLSAQYLCPFLETESGVCRIYLQRPIACRTYGFYRGADGGRYCGAIEAQVAGGTYGNVIWGNHSAVERRLDRCGLRVPLLEWFRGWNR